MGAGLRRGLAGRGQRLARMAGERLDVVGRVWDADSAELSPDRLRRLPAKRLAGPGCVDLAALLDLGEPLQAAEQAGGVFRQSLRSDGGRDGRDRKEDREQSA